MRESANPRFDQHERALAKQALERLGIIRPPSARLQKCVAVKGNSR
jgi:hypothetical protein